jgi:hypothetical protein
LMTALKVSAVSKISSISLRVKSLMPNKCRVLNPAIMILDFEYSVSDLFVQKPVFQSILLIFKFSIPVYTASDSSTILSSPSVSFQLTTTFCEAIESTSMPV